MFKEGMRRWYLLQTFSGYEDSVKSDLEKRIETMGQQDYIFNVLVPEEEIEEEKKDGTKVIKKRKMFPSYVFVEMIVTEKSWFIVRNTPKVTGFLGSSGKGAKPVPVLESEMNAILTKIGLIQKPVFNFNVGEKVEVISGPFKGSIVEVSSVDNQKETITFMFEMFNRLTPTEVKFSEVKKLAKEDDNEEEQLEQVEESPKLENDESEE